MTYATSVKFGRRLCEALGLEPERTTSVRLELDAGKLAVVWVRRYIADEEMDALLEVLTEYHLLENEQTVGPATTQFEYVDMHGHEHVTVQPVRAAGGA